MVDMLYHPDRNSVALKSMYIHYTQTTSWTNVEHLNDLGLSAAQVIDMIDLE